MKNLKKYLLLAAALPLGSYLLAQTGAAGVGNSSNNVIWLDAHSMGLSDGSQVSSFTDNSGNSNDFSQISSGKRPIYSTGVLNGLPVVTFDGFDDVLNSGSFSGLETTDLTYFIVFKKENLTSQTLLTSSFSSDETKWRSYCNAGNNKIISAHYSPTIKHVNYVDGNVGTYLSAHITSSKNEVFNEGVLQMSKNEGMTVPTGLIDVTLGNLYNNPLTSHYALKGYIAEVIIYNTQLNELEKVLIENYLAAKYGLGAPTDLYAYEGTHNIELIGIGDDGSNSQTISQGKGIVEISSPASMGSNEYLIAAHTDVSTANFTTADIPASISASKRFERTWRVDETGDVGSFDLKFVLSGLDDFANPTTYRLLVDTDGDFSDASVISGSYSSGTVTFNVDLNDGDYFTLAGEQQSLVIESTNVTNDWSLTTTWDCACIPTANDDVYIMPGHTVNVDVDASVKYLSIDGTLNMDDDVTLSNFGNLDMTVPVTFNNGTFALVGATPQDIDPAGQLFTLNNLTINNSTGSDLNFIEGQYLLNGTLNPISGNMILDPAPNEFVINSTSATTGGRVGAMESSFSVSGLFTVRRHIAAGNADWRNLASPVLGATFADWDADLVMSGDGFPDGCATFSDGCFYSVRYTNNSVDNPVLDVNQPITNTRGFEVFCGTDLVTFDETILETVGTLNDANDIVQNINTGWATIGNPYACPITYNSIEKTSQISDYYYVYDASSGSYQWYDEASQTSSVPEITGDGLIAMSQGIWVYATSAGSLTYRQSDKSTDNATFIRNQNSAPSEFKITLKENSTTFSCTMSIEEGTETTDEFDIEGDMIHLAPGNEKASSIAFDFGENLVRKNFISPDVRDKSFRLYVNILREGYYTLSAENIFDGLKNYSKVLIFDSETNEFFDFKKNENYSFYGEEGESDRFRLILSNAPDLQTAGINGIESSNEEISIIQMGNMVDISSPGTLNTSAEISIVNLLGQREVLAQTLDLSNGSNLLTLPENLNGVHIISVIVDGKRISKKLVF